MMRHLYIIFLLVLIVFLATGCSDNVTADSLFEEIKESLSQDYINMSVTMSANGVKGLLGAEQDLFEDGETSSDISKFDVKSVFGYETDGKIARVYESSFSFSKDNMSRSYSVDVWSDLSSKDSYMRYFRIGENVIPNWSESKTIYFSNIKLLVESLFNDSKTMSMMRAGDAYILSWTADVNIVEALVNTGIFNGSLDGIILNGNKSSVQSCTVKAVVNKKTHELASLKVTDGSGLEIMSVLFKKIGGDVVLNIPVNVASSNSSGTAAAPVSLSKEALISAAYRIGSMFPDGSFSYSISSGQESDLMIFSLSYGDISISGTFAALSGGDSAAEALFSTLNNDASLSENFERVSDVSETNSVAYKVTNGGNSACALYAVNGRFVLNISAESVSAGVGDDVKIVNMLKTISDKVFS